MGCSGTCLPVLVQINLQRFNIFFESERAHCPEQIISVDCFTLFALTLVTSFACDEADELGDALLNSFFCVFRYLGICWQSFFHYSADVCDRKETILLANVAALVVIVVVDIGIVGIAHAFLYYGSVARRRYSGRTPAPFDFPNHSIISIYFYDIFVTFIYQRREYISAREYNNDY